MTEEERKTVAAVAARDAFIKQHLAGMPAEFIDAHLGLDPNKWQAEAASIKQSADAILKPHRDAAGAKSTDEQAAEEARRDAGMSPGAAAFARTLKIENGPQPAFTTPTAAQPIVGAAVASPSPIGAMSEGASRLAASIKLPRQASGR